MIRGFLLALAIAPTALASAPSVVRVEKTADGFTLARDGRPYFIKGGGGDGSMELLARCGGNSVRTWGAEKAGAILDEAQKHGLTVTVGIWLGHRRHGFNYEDPKAVERQFEQACEVVRKYKDHPALLMWGLGNEMEGDRGDDLAVWKAVERLAAEVKRIDPNHPTMTVIAELGGDKVKNLHKFCPSVDVVGINSYGGGPSVTDRYRTAGGTKPFVLTEFGPNGMWEAGKTPWGAPIEKTSTAKADDYARVYAKTVAPKGLCLGSYAFIWGHKQEATATWFGLLLPDGSKLAGVYALGEGVVGPESGDACPRIEALTIEGPAEVAPGASVTASLKASDPEGAALEVEWRLVGEVERYSTGGDAESPGKTIEGAVATSSKTGATVRMPKARGGYRLYVTVRDGHGGAAVANVPLRVK